MYTLEQLPHGQNDAVFAEEGLRLRVRPLACGAVRVTFTGAGTFAETGSGAVLPQEAGSCSVRMQDGAAMVDCGALSVRVELATGRLSYHNAAGVCLMQEPARPARSLTKREVYANRFDPDVKAECFQSADGPKARAGACERVFDRMAYEALLPFDFGEDEALFGLGSHEEGYGNLRGRHRQLYQQNMKIVLPFFVSTRGYGVLVDCGSLMTFHDDAEGAYLWCDCVDQLDYYVMAGPGFDSVVATYRQLTGPTPLFPRWFFGYAQSKEHYHTQQELVDVVAEYRRTGVPLDLIVQDWFTWPEGLWGQKSFDDTRYPNPTAMVDAVHDMHAKVMLSIWPIMLGDGENQREMLEAGHLLGNQANYDAFSPKARQLYWQQASRGLFCHGLDAWWCDCTEPFEKDWDGQVKPQPCQRMALNVGEAKTYLDEARINLFSLYHSQGIYEGQRQEREDKRVVNLTRSAFAGQHRYGAIAWSGDICATWDTLRRQIPEGVNFCAGGEPYWTVDIGGFFVRRRPDKWFWAGDYDAGCEDLGYRELYTRWLQYGTFLPMMRSHGTDTPREVWHFGTPGTPFYDTITAFIRLRTRLVPWLYSMSAATTLRSYTMMRAVALDYPADRNTHQLTEQYLLGKMLVCPVTRPMYYGSGSRPLEGCPKSIPVYLPAGTGWVDYWSGACFGGGQWVTADAPLEKMPLYLPSGAILPLGPEQQYVGETPNPPLELHIYPGADGSFTLYDDAGDGYDYEQGAYSEITLGWCDAQGTLTIGRRSGGYPGMSAARAFTLVLHAATGEVHTPVTYTGEQAVVRLGNT